MCEKSFSVEDLNPVNEMSTHELIDGIYYFHEIKKYAINNQFLDKMIKRNKDILGEINARFSVRETLLTYIKDDRLIYLGGEDKNIKLSDFVKKRLGR